MQKQAELLEEVKEKYKRLSDSVKNSEIKKGYDQLKKEVF